MSGDWANAHVITLSVMIRTGQRGYILTENYYIPSDEANLLILFFGGRRLIINAGLDFGLLFTISMESTFFAIPWLGLTIPFGKTNYTTAKN